MNFENNISANKEDKSPKEQKIEKARQEVENWGDALGMPLDGKIKEAIVMLNVWGFPTGMSCEGHLDSGYPAPWVTITADDNIEEFYENETEIYKQVAAKYGVSVEEVKKGDNMEAWKEAVNIIRQQPETKEAKLLREKNEKLKQKLQSLLEEFYQAREVTEEERLMLEDGAFDFMLHNGGKFFIPNEMEFRWAELSQADRDRKGEVLEAAQMEMEKFSNFLKTKYLKHE
ncbi:MAG: hypothetical protein ACOCU8_03290 [Patescibacteria group bacterium]